MLILRTHNVTEELFQVSHNQLKTYGMAKMVLGKKCTLINLQHCKKLQKLQYLQISLDFYKDVESEDRLKNISRTRSEQLESYILFIVPTMYVRESKKPSSQMNPDICDQKPFLAFSQSNETEMHLGSYPSLNNTIHRPQNCSEKLKLRRNLRLLVPRRGKRQN